MFLYAWKIKFDYQGQTFEIVAPLSGEWPVSDFIHEYSGLNLNQDKATKPQTVQIVRQGEVTPYWFKVNPL